MFLLATLFLAAPIVLSSVSADVDGPGGEELLLTVVGERPFNDVDVELRVAKKELFLVLPGTRARADRRRWVGDVGVVRAHRHRGYTELAVPLPVGHGCVQSAGKLTVSTEGQLRLRVPCDNLGQSGRPTRVVSKGRRTSVRSQHTEVVPASTLADMVLSAVQPRKDSLRSIVETLLRAKKSVTSRRFLSLMRPTMSLQHLS